MFNEAAQSVKPRGNARLLLRCFVLLFLDPVRNKRIYTKKDLEAPSCEMSLPL